MDSSEVNKIYSLYEILNDFNRLIILIFLYDKELSIIDISKGTNLNPTVINHQLDYLINKRIVSKNTDRYKISNRLIKKIITRMREYIN